MPRLVRSEPAQRFDTLAFGRHRAPAFALIGGDDDVHQTLEEVALLGRARAPGRLERLVGVEEPSSASLPTMSRSIVSVRSHSAACGAISASQKARAVCRISCCSSESVKSTGRS